MSFGWSVSDIAQLVRLAYKTTQGARAACGEYDELTRETYALHVILQRLRDEADEPHSFINRPGETYKQELESISSGCQHVLTQLDKILEKYNALSDQEKSVRKLWKQVRFGSGAVADVADLRSKITSYTATLSLFINLVSMKTVGEVERQMNGAGGDLRDIKIAVNGITARLSAKAGQEGSVFTAYTNDDKDAWRELRRGLVRQGFGDGLVRRHMETIMAYVKELGSRGVLDGIEAVAFIEGSSIRDETVSGRQITTESSSPTTVQEMERIRSHSDQTESINYTNDPPRREPQAYSHTRSIHGNEAEESRNLHRQPYVESDTEDEVISHSPLETPPINPLYPEPGYEVQGDIGPEFNDKHRKASDDIPSYIRDECKGDGEDQISVLNSAISSRSPSKYQKKRQDIIQDGSKLVLGNINPESRKDSPSKKAIGSAKTPFHTLVPDKSGPTTKPSRLAVPDTHRFTPEISKTLDPDTLRSAPKSSDRSVPGKLVDCFTCSRSVPKCRSAYLACQHRMCHDCLRRIFTLSTTFPQLMPPKCCTADHIPLRHVDRLFDLKFKKTWNLKYQEFKTKPENRIYCPTRMCGEFISQDRENRHTGQDLHGERNYVVYVVCQKCGKKVCCDCKGLWSSQHGCGCKPVTAAE